jgi:RHS repeat-associated protein
VLGALLGAAIGAAVLPPAKFTIVWAAGNYPVVVSSDLPVGYWRLDETSGTTAADSSSGHANPLTYQGGFTLLTQPGAISGDADPAVSLNGTTGAVTATKATTTGTTNWSLEAWLNPSTLPQAGVVAYDGQIGTNGYGFAVGATNGSSLTSGSHLIGILGSVTMFDSGFNFSAPNTWYHVVMTRDTSKVTLYANAVAQATTSTQAPVAPGARFSLGSGFTSTPAQTNPFAGSIDEAASYNALLSPARILAHYTEGAAVQSAFGNWVSVTPSNPPSARFEPAMGWDAGHNKVVLFGGKSSSGSAIQETWTWDGTTWTKLTPATQPSARWGANIVYDTALGKMVLFGGTTGSHSQQDTWTWDGTTWASVTTSTKPSARLEYGLAYDPANSVVVMFGGTTGSAALQDTYTFNGTNWTAKTPAAKPSIRSGVAMTYSASANNTVLFGGVSGTSYNAETWVWDGTNWTQKAPTGAPSARSNSGLAYNTTTSTVALAGGVNGSSYFGDTWTWDGTNWTQQLPPSSPTVRAGAGFAYNGVIGADSLFGGLSGTTYLNDTRAWANPPVTPSGVTATAGNAQATVSWTAPANGGSAITGYVVTPYVGSQPGTSATPSASPVTITGLTNGTAYTFKVYAKNAIGNGPVGVSNPVTPATLPGAPTGVTAVPGNAQATVSWTAPSSNGGSAITKYTITGTPGGSAILNCTCTPPLQQTVTGLTNGTSYTFTVTATNSAGTGSASSPPSAAITVGAPTAPQTPSATAGANQATVTWTAPASSNGPSVTGYVVTAYLGTQAENRVSTGASATSVTVSGLVGASQYTFQIVASNSVGASPAATTNAVTPTGSTSTYFTTVRGDNPIAYWRLDDPSGTVAADSSGNGHDATYTGGITYSATSLIPSDADPAVTLDGSGSTYLSASTLTPLQGDNARSVELWFKTTSGNQQGIFDSGNGCVSAQAFGIFLTGPNQYGNPPRNTPGLDVGFCNDDVYLPDLNVSDGNLHHVVVTLSGTSVNVYVDGRTPQGSVWNGSSWTALGAQPLTLPVTPNTTANPILIGASRVVGGHFAGTIDEVAVYSTVLSATQVQNHLTAAQVTLTAPVIGSVAPGANQVTVTWTDTSNPNAFPGYIVTAYSGTIATVSKGVSSSATSATLTGLMGSSAYTIKVSLSNAFSSFSATSSSVTTTGNPSSYASTVQTTTPQPVIYYRLSDTGTTIAADSSGNGQTGAYVGTPTPGAGSALANDSDAAVTFGSGYVLNSGTNMPIGNSSRTVELWLKTTSTANMSLLQWGDNNSGGTGFNVQLQYGNQIWINLNNGTNPILNLPYSIANGQWHQVILTFDGSTFIVYVDGQLANNLPYGGINTDRNVLTIGNGFQGSLDEVAVYSGVLTSTQASGHFLASGNSQPAPPATVTATAGANAATVSWTASPTNPYPVVGYIVTAYNGTQVAGAQATGPSATSATIGGLQMGVAYSFTVGGINNFGIGTSASSLAVTPTGAATTPYAATVIGTGPSGNGPVAYWRLGDGSSSAYAADSSGNGAYAIYNTGTTLGGGGALLNDPDTSMAGSLSYTSGRGLPVGNTSRSVELWLKTTSTANMQLVQWGNPTLGGTFFHMQITNGYRIWVNVNNATNPAINSPYNLANGQWHYIVLTWNGSVFTLYVDGTAAGTWNNSALATNSWGLQVGNGFTGNLDEVAVYNRALSASEVTAHFQASGNSQPAASDPGTVGTSVGQNQVTVSWDYCHVTPPSQDCVALTNPSPVTGFLVTAYASGLEQESVFVAATRASVLMSGLQGGTSYTFSVAAVNNFGIGGSMSSPAVTPTGNSATYRSTVLGSGPIAYYRLDDSAPLAADSSPSNLIGSYTGTYTQGAQGALTGDPDPAMSGGGLQVNQISGFPFGAASRTLEVWFKTSSTSAQNLASYGDQNAGGTLFDFQTLSGGTQLNLLSTTTNLAFTTPYNIADGQWHMADVTYDGTNLAIYLDGASIGSHAFGLNTDSGAVFAAGPFSGSLDELSVYNRALSPTDVTNHWTTSGAGVPAAPTGVTAVAGVNSAVVSWLAPAPRGGPVTSYTITPQLQSAPSLAPSSVTASTTSTNIPNLPAGTSISFAVTANNKYGTGLAATSPFVTIQGSLPAPNLDRFLAIAEAGNVSRGIYYDGWVSHNKIPATSLGQWTIEGFIWSVSSQNTSTGNMAWGLLNTTMITNPNGDDYFVPSWDTPQAGINFNIGALHGIGNPDVSFVWPHNGNTGYGTNGQYTPPNNLGAILNSNTPVYVALDYDGTNVRGYINGALSFTVADSAAIPANAWAGFFDETELRTGAFDGFRVSNIARYTGSAMTVPSADPPSDANTLVDYNFDNYSVGAKDGILMTPFSPWSPITGGNWPDSSTNGNSATLVAFTNPWALAWYAFSPLQIQTYEMNQGISPGELADECSGVNTGSGNFCQRSTDMSIPGRGPALSLVRTYNTFADTALGPFGYGWSTSYDAHLVIDQFADVTVYDALGGSEFFANQNGSFQTSSYVPITLTFSGGNYTLTDKRGGKVVFNSSGQLIQEIDPNPVYVTTLAYANGKLSSVTEPGGRQLTYTYWSNGLVSTVSDGTRTVTYHYDDGNLNLTSVVDVLGGTTSYTYDSLHRLTFLKAPTCNVTPGCPGLKIDYDSNGRVGKQTDPAGNFGTYTYATSWPLFTTTVTDPLGHQTVYDYALNLPIDIVQAANTSLAAKTTFAYDPATLGTAAITKPDLQTDTATYDLRGNQLSTTDSLGNRLTYTYNSLSEPLTVQDPMGVVTTYTYDSNGNPLTSSTPLVGSNSNQITTYTYSDTNHPGDVTAVTDPTNRTVTYTYDSYGDVASSTDPLTNKTTYVYDSLGRMTSAVSPLGNVTGGNPAAYTTTYTYNAARQPLTITDPLGHQVVNQFDVGGRITQSTDGNGNVTKFSFDLLGRPTSSTAGYGTAQATTDQTSYDADGNVLSKTDGLTHTLASYTYDALNRQATSADGLARATTYTYDSVNRLTSDVDPLNKTTSYVYDSGGRLTGTSYSDGSASETYTYDAEGHLLTMADGTGTTTNVFDSLQRLTQQTDGAGHVVGYGYDLAARLTSIAYPGGNCNTPTLCVTRQYDGAGRPSSVQDWLSHRTTFGYDANSNMTGINYPNGVVATWTYDNADHLTGISDVNGANTILSLGYTRDNNSQLTGENSISYSYNSLNQLTSGAGLGYSYDVAGRLTQTVNGSTTTNYNYDNADQLLSTAIVGGSTLNYGYDAAGRRTSAGSTSLTWDQQDRLLTYGSGSSYSYNATGLRVSKTVAGQTEAFVWDTAAGLPLLLQDGSTSYVTGPGGLPLEQVSGSTVYYYHQDQLGSTRAVTDATGTISASYSYDAFGNLNAQTGNISNPFLFSGQYRDAESGLYYLRARYYDPATGQFISRDPELASTWEPYSYVAQNPLNATDPSGLCFGFGPSSNGICDFVRDNATSAAHGVMNWIGAEMHAPEGRLLFGFVAGSNLSISITNDPWYNAGEALGVIVFAVCMLDGLGEALGAVRLVARFARSAKELSLLDKEAGISRAADGPGGLERRVFEGSLKHPDVSDDSGQAALDNSLQVKENSARRIGIDYDRGQFVVLDQTYPGRPIFHGHYRTWAQLDNKMKAVLQRWGMVNRRGEILIGGKP